MEINHTAATNDDIVGGNETTSCRLRLVGADQGIGATVTLSAADVPGKGLVDFQWVNEPPLYLNSDGTWQYVMITGVRGSAAINDARINIHRERFSYEGSPIFPDTHKDVTVFWFKVGGLDNNPARIAVAEADAYQFTNGDTLRPNGTGVYMTALHKVYPEGVDCNAPQLANRHVGIVQNVTSATRTETYKNPQIAFFPEVAVGTSGSAPATHSITKTLPRVANDVAFGRPGPLYDSSVSVCTGIYTTVDSPQFTTETGLQQFELPALDAAGTRVGTAYYEGAELSMADNYLTYAVQYNTASNAIYALRQIPWSVNVTWDTTRQDNPTEQKATTAAYDEDVSEPPVTTGDTANTLMNAAANRSESDSTERVSATKQEEPEEE